MNKRCTATLLCVTMTTALGTPATVWAASSLDMKKKVVGVTGIMNVSNLDAYVSRAEFAQMLVNASTYRSGVGQESNIAVFADVNQNNEYASYIRIAVEQGWMSGYLGGLFKPEEAITMQEAAKAVLTLLGYSNQDFTGNQTGNRMAKFQYLELDEGIYRQQTELLSRQDCVNLFYNLLKTNTRDNEGKTASSTTIYGAVLNCSLSSDGEINPLNMLDSTLKGPKAVLGRSLSDLLPFHPSKGNLFLNGEAATAEAIESDESTVIYYNTATKTVWAYNDQGEYKGAYTGVITNIYYKSTDVMVPSGITFEGDESRVFSLDSSDMQFAFSLYGDTRVGDEITIVWEKTVNSEGEESYSVVDYIE